jgi:dolichol kinase
MSVGLRAPSGAQDIVSSSATWVPESTDSERWFSGSLTLREIRRRFWHMAPGLLAFLLHAIPHRDPISPTLQWIIVGCCAAIGLRILMGFRHIQRSNEANGTAAVAGYVLSVLVTILLFPQQLELGLAVLAILAFGDGSATLFGLLIRGPRLPWNRAKSCSGLLSFVVVGSLMASWIYYGETHNPEGVDPAVTFVRALMLVSPAVIAAAIAESIDSRINDNVRVGIVASLVLAATHMILV